MPKQYVVETRWAWDKSHTEFCTFTFGDNALGEPATDEPDFSILFKHSRSQSDVDRLMHMIGHVCDEQNGNPMGDCKPAAIYHVAKSAMDFSIWTTEHGNLTFELELVGRFDQRGEPIIDG